MKKVKSESDYFSRSNVCTHPQQPIIHITYPASNQQADPDSSPKPEAPEDTANKTGTPTSSFWPPLPPASSQQSADVPAADAAHKSTQIWSAVPLSERERKQNALKILQELLGSPVFRQQQQQPGTCGDHLYELLAHRSADGQTPFMYAVNVRAYEAALLLFDHCLHVRNNFVHSHLAPSPNNNNNNNQRYIRALY